MVCDGPNWCLAACMLRNYYQTLSTTAKTGVIKYFVTDRQFCMTDRHFVKLFKLPKFPISQGEHTFCFAYPYFFMHHSCHLEQENQLICFLLLLQLFRFFCGLQIMQ